MVTTKTKPQAAPAAPAPYAPDENDFVADVLAAVHEIWPELCAEKLRQAEAQIRERWGGDRPYIGRRPGQGRSARNEAILRDHRQGERMPLLVRRYGLSERHILRILQTASAVP